MEDRIAGLLSEWLRRGMPDAELRERVEALPLEALSGEPADAVDELLAELRDPEGHPGELSMIVRETLEAVALG